MISLKNKQKQFNQTKKSKLIKKSSIKFIIEHK